MSPRACATADLGPAESRVLPETTKGGLGGSAAAEPRLANEGEAQMAEGINLEGLRQDVREAGAAWEPGETSMTRLSAAQQPTLSSGTTCGGAT